MSRLLIVAWLLLVYFIQESLSALLRFRSSEPLYCAVFRCFSSVCYLRCYLRGFFKYLEIESWRNHANSQLHFPSVQYAVLFLSTYCDHSKYVVACHFEAGGFFKKNFALRRIDGSAVSKTLGISAVGSVKREDLNFIGSEATMYLDDLQTHRNV